MTSAISVWFTVSQIGPDAQIQASKASSAHGSVYGLGFTFYFFLAVDLSHVSAICVLLIILNKMLVD